jgi:hypothetical protein
MFIKYRYRYMSLPVLNVESSVSDPDLEPHWIRIGLASWIRIRIRNAAPDPGGVKSAKTEGENGNKRQKIHHKKLKLPVVYESIF